MNSINATNQSLINILLQQATKSSEKKPRPSFEEVFSKLNARTTGMNANKHPMNNMLTNEQLFRYYIKETEPKLRVSDESFNIEDAFNPMKESDPNKVYGQGTTQSTNIIPSINPYNNSMNIGYQDPLQAQAEAAAVAARTQAAAVAAAAATRGGSNRPISRKLATLIQQYGGGIPPVDIAPVDIAPLLEPTEPAVNASLLPIGSDAVIIDYNMAKDELSRAENLINRLSEINWNDIPPETATIFSILFNNNEFYPTETTEYMKGLIKTGKIEEAIQGINYVFKQTKGNIAVNDFITERMAVMMGIDTTAGIGAVERFNKQFNPNNIGIGVGKMTMERFTINILNYLNSQGSLQGNEKLRVDRTILDIEDRGIAGNANKYIGEITNKFQALELQYNSLIPSSTAIMSNLFFDGITELTTNTDINSVDLDPELVKLISNRGISSSANSAATYASVASTIAAMTSSVASAASASSTTAEAGSPSGINIDDVIERRGRGGRGVQPGDIRGPYTKPKKMAGEIIGDIIGSAVNIAEAKLKK
jgi:hypothetical protein